MIPKCPSCETTMEIVDVRGDGCRYFSCSECGLVMGEETKEWFAHAAELLAKTHKVEMKNDEKRIYP